MKDVLIIQTGATAWQAAQRLGGTGQLPLSDEGIGAVREHLAAMVDCRLDTILTDDSEAARQTADMVAQRLGGKIRLVEGLRDVHMGLWEGLSVDEVRQRYPKVFRQWQEQPATVRPPEGEDFTDAFARVVAAVRAALKKRGSKQVGVVASPLVAGLLRCWLLGRELDAVWQEVREGAPPARYEVTRAHLTDGQKDEADR